MVKNLPACAGDARNSDLITAWKTSSGIENGNPLQYSCLENPVARGGWWATVRGVMKSDTTEHSCIGRIGNFIPIT